MMVYDFSGNSVFLIRFDILLPGLNRNRNFALGNQPRVDMSETIVSIFPQCIIVNGKYDIIILFAYRCFGYIANKKTNLPIALSSRLQSMWCLFFHRSRYINAVYMDILIMIQNKIQGVSRAISY